MMTIPSDLLATITGGKNKTEGPVSPETVGCAVGGALASEGGPPGIAAGCIGGGAIANNVTRMSNADRAKFTRQARVAHLGPPPHHR